MPTAAPRCAPSRWRFCSPISVSPRVTADPSYDNPYWEAQFKTLKYQPDFPARFDSIEHACAFCQRFFAWYNHAHRHSGIGLYDAGGGAHRPGAAPRLYAAR
jgi:transposase InsO family protein